jgi:UPF0716 protein FxsA
MPLLMLFPVLVLAEIAGFVLVGQWLGLLPTLLLVLAAALFGGLVLRWQGMATVMRLQTMTQRGEIPVRAVGDVMLIGLAGLLLLVPGFVTDIIGLLLLLPWTRALIYRLLARRFRVVEVRPGAYREAGPGLIDLDEGDWRGR